MGAMHCALTGGEQRTGAVSGGRSLGCCAVGQRTGAPHGVRGLLAQGCLGVRCLGVRCVSVSESG